MNRPRNRRLARSITEASFQRNVIEYARLCRWKHYHTKDSRGSNPGFPDLVLVRPPRVVFLELKSEDGKVKTDQAEWFEALRMCGGVEVSIVRPSGWRVIEKMLR